MLTENIHFKLCKGSRFIYNWVEQMTEHTNTRLSRASEQSVLAMLQLLPKHPPFGKSLFPHFFCEANYSHFRLLAFDETRFKYEITCPLCPMMSFVTLKKFVKHVTLTHADIQTVKIQGNVEYPH